MAEQNEGIEVSVEELRAKYAEEQLKRLRTDGLKQFAGLKEQFEELDQDPYADPNFTRDAIVEETEVVIVGGGFAGMLTGIDLQNQGITNFRIVEKGGDFGGTWYWNRYPGAQCDTASFVYMPLLEETGHMPSEKYCKGPEILDHCRRIGEHFDLYEKAVFSTEVTSLDWDESASRWIIKTNRGDEMRAKFIAMGTGPLHRPKLPGIAGIDTFGGHTFHTSRWDYEYTGGNPAGAPLDGLADKRVGIIGTGATSVQCIPHLARAAKELFVFQRTPSSIDVRNNHSIDPEWFDTLEPGWQQRWLVNFTTLQTGGFVDEDLVKDGWTDISKRIRDKLFSADPPEFTPEAMERAYHDSDDEKMTEVRARVDQVVDDEITAEKLKPWYRQLCKRPCFHDEYLLAYNEPGTHLIDTDGKGVERIDDTGIWANGEHYELDCLIYASGFEVGTEYARRSGFETVGRDGLTLSEYWADGMSSLHGIHMHGFPNLFMVQPTHGANLISNIPHNLIERGNTIAAIVKHASDIDADRVEVTPEAEAAWMERLITGGRQFAGNPDCTPGYYNNEGQDAGPGDMVNRLGFPEGPTAYFEYITDWRSSGEFAGLEFRS